MSNSTLSGNSVNWGNGSGIYSSGTLIVSNSILYGNWGSSCYAGGGIYNDGGIATVITPPCSTTNRRAVAASATIMAAL